MKHFLAIASLVLIGQIGIAQNLHQNSAAVLDDTALDRITAGGVDATLDKGIVRFQGQVPTANGLVQATGDLALLKSSNAGNSLGSITLNGSAQQGLNSLLNINAANSNISVLLNLNVNINSTVGTLTQSNMLPKLP
jgi:hypothetical protein